VQIKKWQQTSSGSRYEVDGAGKKRLR